jgi:hypothetical protein
MSDLASRKPRRLPPGWRGKLVWLALGIAVFSGAYLAGNYVAPVVAVVVRLYKAIFNVFLHPPNLPWP